MAMKSYFMDELHNIHAEIVSWKNKTKDPTSVDVKGSELQSLNKSTSDSHNHMGLDKSNGKKPEHTKIINNVRNYSKKPQTDWSNNGAKANKVSVIIVGDSTIKHVNDRDISHSHIVKVRPNPGASTHDLLDYVKTAMQKKPKVLVIHTGTNDIQQEINTMKMIKKLIKVIKEWDSEKETEIMLAALIQREYHDFRNQIEEINGKLNRYFESKGYRFVENSNIDGCFLNRSKFHLNKKGTALLSRNIVSVLKYIWYTSNSDGEFTDTKISGNNEVSGQFKAFLPPKS